MLTVRLAIVENVIVLLAFMSGAWGPRPCATELHRGVYVTTDEPRVSDEPKAVECYESGESRMVNRPSTFAVAFQ